MRSFKYRQQPSDVGRRSPSGSGCRQQPGHRDAFVHKSADESARLGECQRFTEHVQRLDGIAVRLESERLEDHDLEPFIRPTALPPPACRQGSSSASAAGGFSLGQVDARRG